MGSRRLAARLDSSPCRTAFGLSPVDPDHRIDRSFEQGRSGLPPIDRVRVIEALIVDVADEFRMTGSLSSMAKSNDGVRHPGGMDQLDREIISLLESDGRRSYREMSRIVGLSDAATRQRVHRLIERKALRIVGVADPLALGARTVAMVGVRCSGDLRRIAKALSEADEIVYVVIATGRYQILVEVICETEGRLLEILDQTIHSVEGVISTETFSYLRIEKQVFTWAWGGGNQMWPGGRHGAISSGSRRASSRRT
jgi:Lrp/AsnC family transcriptional regulator for asnA, asnC and gidA